MAARKRAEPYDGKPQIMLIRGPRHGWVYSQADLENRPPTWGRSSFDGYSPMHENRGDPDAPVVVSTIGAELPHTCRTDPDLAAQPVQLWCWTEPEPHLPPRRPPLGSRGGGNRRRR